MNIVLLKHGSKYTSSDVNKQVKSLNKTVNKYGKYIEELEKDIAILKDV